MATKDAGEGHVEYQKYLADYLQLTNDRERFARELKDAPPGVQKQGYPILQQLDESLRRIESELALEYDHIVAERRREEELGKLFTEGDDAVEELFIDIRDNKPHLLEAFKTVVFQGMSEEEEQDFYDRIAVRESGLER